MTKENLETETGRGCEPQACTHPSPGELQGGALCPATGWGRGGGGRELSSFSHPQHLAAHRSLENGG